MSTKEYSARLKLLSETNKEILTRISTLSKLTPRSQDGSRTELAEDIHSSLRDLESEFELFRQEAEEAISPPQGSSQRKASIDRGNERTVLITQIEKFTEDLKLSRAHFRRASLQAKKNEEDAQRKAREQLFAGAGEDSDRPHSSKRRARDENKSQDELTLSAAGDVTAGLRRLHQQLDESLGRNNYAREILEASTAALQELDETYSSVVEQGLKTARGLVGKLISSQKSDTWYLETALYILVGTLIWLIFRRWFFGPLLYFIYRPSRFMLSIVYSALNLTLGILTGTVFQGAQHSVGHSEVTSHTRPPLIIKPSAGRGQQAKRQGTEKPTIKVGLGGGGSAERRDPVERQREADSLAAEIANMAEQTKNAEKAMGEAEKIRQEGSGAAGSAGQRGDGTNLRERAADEKPNPKKRMMEAPPPPENEEQAKDEL